jgi:hypothetical protein
MNKQIEAIRRSRSFLLDQLKDLSDEQLNRIPEGFNNNIIWNLGHMITVQQGVCYKRAGLPTLISDDFLERYKPGSKPEGLINAEEIAYIKNLLVITLEQLEADYNKQVFGNYKAWTTRHGVELADIDDGIKFLSLHDNLHSGTIMAINRFAKK